MSPLLANLALTHLDDYFQARWAVHRNATNRARYRKRGGATYRIVRYADDFVILVNGSRVHAEAQWEEVGEVLSEVGLRLAPEKTRVGHIALLTELTAVFGQAVDGAVGVPASLPA